MKKWQIAGLVIVIVLLAGIVIAEQMTFSTYYPAPYGRYREFSTTGRTTLATNEFGIETDEYARVGIGTTEPAFPLTVIGRIGSSSLSTNGRILLHWEDTGGGVGNINSFDTDHYTRMKIEGNPVTFNVSSNGNVGIGTTDPQTLLHMRRDQNDATTFFIDNKQSGSESQARLYIQSLDGGGLLTYRDEAFTAFSRTHLADRFELRADGGSSGLTLMSAKVGSDIRFYTDGDTPERERMRITSAGNVGIGTASPSHLIELSGGAYCDGTGGWIAGSSRELKKDIQPLKAKEYADIVDKLKDVEVVRYRYKDPKEDQRLRIGVISENAPEEFVTSDKKGVSPMDAIGFLLAAAKGQQEEIERLKSAIEGLKGH